MGRVVGAAQQVRAAHAACSTHICLVRHHCCWSGCRGGAVVHGVDDARQVDQRQADGGAPHLQHHHVAAEQRAPVSDRRRAASNLGGPGSWRGDERRVLGRPQRGVQVAGGVDAVLDQHLLHVGMIS